MKHWPSPSKYPPYFTWNINILPTHRGNLYYIFVCISSFCTSITHPGFEWIQNNSRFWKDAEGSTFFLCLRSEEEGPSHARAFTALKLSPKMLSPSSLKGFNALKLCSSSAIWKWSQFFLLQVLQGEVMSCAWTKQTTSSGMGGTRE